MATIVFQQDIQVDCTCYRFGGTRITSVARVRRSGWGAPLKRSIPTSRLSPKVSCPPKVFGSVELGRPSGHRSEGQRCMTLEARRTDDLAPHEHLPPQVPPLAAENRSVRIVAGGDAAVADVPRGSWHRVFPLLLQERQLTRASAQRRRRRLDDAETEGVRPDVDGCKSRHSQAKVARLVPLG